MGSDPTTGRRRQRRLLEIAFVIVAIFAAGLVTAGVVSGAGPLAVLSTDETTTDTTPTDTTTSTDTTSTETTDTTTAETTESETTESESTETTTTTTTETTESETTETTTTTDTTPAWPEATEPYLVKFASGTSTEQQDAVLASAGAESQSYIRALRIHSVLLPGANALQASLDALDAAPSVVRLEPDREREVGGTPNDSEYGDQWSLPLIGWDNAFGSVNVGGSARVAVLDTGIDGSHPDLNVIPGTSILDGSEGLSDPNGHGTAMAGIVAAKTNNGTGVAGVAYAGVQVMPVVVLGSDGTGQDSDIIEGVVYAADHGADVILMAFSNPGYSELLQEAIDYAWDEGVVLVAATGNDGSSSVTFPAGDRGVIGVSNTDQSDALNSSSNYGQNVFLGAPGTSIATTSAGGGYGSITGTSASAAEVAGAAALLRAASGASNGVVVSRLAKNAEAVGTREQTGNGRLNLDRALTDTSSDSVKPVGADPVGSGGPFVGPYVAAAPNKVLTFTRAGSGTGSVTFTRISAGDDPDTPTSGCSTAGAVATCTATGTFKYKNKDTYRIAATASVGSTFVGWSGQTGNLTTTNCGGTTNACPSASGSIELEVDSAITATFNVSGPTKLAFTSLAFTGNYGGCLGPITIQTQDGSNAATNVTSNTTVNLATDELGAFHSGNTCASTIASVAIPTGSNSASFYYRPGAVGDGSHQLTASATGLTSASQVQTVNKKTLTVTPANKTITYGDPDPPFTFSYSGGFVGTDTAADINTPPSCGVSGAHSNAGSYTITCSGGLDNNYDFNTAPTATLTVNKKTLTVTPANKTITYGDPDPPFTFSYSGGFVGTDTAADINTPPSCGVSGAHSNAGSYTITCSGGLDNNYDFNTAPTATLTVNKKTLTVTPANKTITYGDPDPPFTFSYSGGFVGTDTAADINTPPSCGVSGAHSNAGSYTITCSGGLDNNYDFNTAPTATLTVNKKTLTVTPANKTITYGDPDPPFTFSYSGGFVGTDTAADINTPPSCGVSGAHSNAGSYTITCSGGLDNNYDFNTAPTATLTVNKKTLTVTPANKTITYGDPDPPFTFSYSGGFVGTDTAADINTPPSCGVSGAHSNAGSYTITCSGGLDNNYDFNTAPTATLTVNKKTLTVTPANKTITYGDPDPPFTFSYSGGFVGTDTAADINTPPSCGVSGAHSNAGSYTITCSGGLDNNYDFNTAPTATLTVNKKTLTVTPANKTITYGDPDPPFTFSYSGGFVGTDTAADINTPPSCGVSGAHSNAGSYTITCSGGLDNNYDFNTAPTATLTVNKKTLTVTPANKTITYGDPDPPFTFSYSGGFVGTDTAADINTPPSCGVSGAHSNAGSYTITCSGGLDNNYDFNTAPTATLTVNKKTLTVTPANKTITYGDPDPPFTFSYSGGFVGTDTAADINTPPSCGVSGAHSNAGSYTITCSGGLDNNYDFNTAPTATLTVNKKTLTVTPANKTITYGDPDPPFTFSYSGGFVGTDTAADINTPPSCGVSGAHSNAGSYTITCSGGLDNNYDFNTAPTATLTVNKKELTVTADDQSRQYSDPNPSSLGFKYSGFVSGEGQSVIDTPPTCSTTRTAGSAPGTYPITCKDGDDNNYSFRYIAGTFTVSRENARATWTGDMLAFTPPGGGSANVLLRATIQDSNLFPTGDLNYDAYPGDIRNATVTFIVDGGTPAGCGNLAVSLIAADARNGTAQCTTPLTEGDHTVIVQINNYYRGGLVEQAVIEVARPDGSFITGGGYTVITSSSGSYAADPTSRVNYGFNVKYNKNNKNLQGHANIVFRAGGRIYQIKANAMDSLGVALKTSSNATCPGPPSATCLGIAEFRSKANLIDVTDPTPVPKGGNLTLHMTLTDKGEPGKTDTIAVTLWDGNTLLFSSQWNGAKTVEQLIEGGNLVVH